MRWTETLRWFAVCGIHGAERLMISSLTERAAQRQADWLAKVPFFIVRMGSLSGFQRRGFPNRIIRTTQGHAL